ncbi:MAG: SNF2-related protein [Oligoflexus sp.]
MSLLKNFRQYFSYPIITRGQHYYHKGRVKIISESADRIEFSVFGTKRYTLQFYWVDARTIAAQCNCPYGESQGYCKHLWASLMAIDEEGSPFIAGVHHQRNLRLIDESELVEGKRHSYVKKGSNLFGKRIETHVAKSFESELRQLPQVDGWQRYLQRMMDLSSTRLPAKRDAEENKKSKVIYFGLASEYKDLLQIRFYQIVDNKCVATHLPQNPEEWSDYAEQTLLRRIWASRYKDKTVESHDFAESIGQQVISDIRLDPALASNMLRELAASERLFLIDEDFKDLASQQALAWDGDESWQFMLEIKRSGVGGRRAAYSLHAGFQQGDKQLAAENLEYLQIDGFAISAGRIIHIQDIDRSRFEWIWHLYQNEPLPIYARDIDQFIYELHQIPSLPSLLLPDDCPWRYVNDLSPKARIIIKNPEVLGKSVDLQAELRFDYGEWASFRWGERSSVAPVRSDRLLVQRQEQEERAYVLDLLDQDVVFKKDGILVFPTSRLKDLCQSWLQQGWIIEAEGRQLKVASHLRAKVETSGIDWFELDAQADFDGSLIDLPRLLRAMEEGQSLVLLDDGSFGLLPEEWVKRFAPIARYGRRSSAGSGRLAFHRSQGLMLDSISEDLEVDRGFSLFRKNLRSFQGIKPVKPNASFQGELRDYQMDGLAWLNFLREFGLGGCLADDMGLGKTVQVLAMLQTFHSRRKRQDPKPSLVVVPKTLMYNWKQETLRFAPKLKLVAFEGSERHVLLEAFQSFDLVLVTYGVLRRDYHLLQDYPFAYVILDEAQTIKNYKAETAHAARSLQAEHRLALSGTPVENHLGELGSIFEFLNPGLFGSKGVQDLARSRDAQEVEPLIRSLRPLILRRTKEQVLTELPDKFEQTVYCELNGAQKKEYNQLRDYYRASLQEKISEQGFERSSMHVLEALLRLRQAACHPGLLDAKRAGASSGKLDLLMHQIEELIESGHKALVFSQFTKLLGIVRSQLEKRGVLYEYLDGKTRKREDKVHRFQTDSQCRVFLISLKAGGVGLNLTAADYCFILDPWWNPAVEAQAIDRVYRIGQEKQVFAYRLIAKGTVEEKILELQKQKKELSDSVVSAEGGFLRSMTSEDLEMLLS